MYVSDSEESDDEREDSDVRSFETAQKEKARVFEEDGDESDLGEFEGEDIYEGATRGFWIKGSPDRHNLYRMIETAQTERKQFRYFEEAFEVSDGEESDYDTENLGTQMSTNKMRQLVTRIRGSEHGARLLNKSTRRLEDADLPSDYKEAN